MREFFTLILMVSYTAVFAQVTHDFNKKDQLCLRSKDGHKGVYEWKMKRVNEVFSNPEDISKVGYSTAGWLQAILPGTVLNSLVYNKIFPEPYFGTNNLKIANIIPDISDVGRDFYTFWFRTEFDLPKSFDGRQVWIQMDGINYRAEVWLNGNLVSSMAGMFCRDFINVTPFVESGKTNCLTIKTIPVDVPGKSKTYRWGDNLIYNGGDEQIGRNVTMMMMAGWDFTFYDGIRDRNTGVWKDIFVYPSGIATLRHPFVKSNFLDDKLSKAEVSISIEVANHDQSKGKYLVEGEIQGTNIKFEKQIELFPYQNLAVNFTAHDFPQLKIENPRIWWPVNKGSQEMYELEIKVKDVNGIVSDESRTKFGIREITTDVNTPDNSRTFYVNRKQIFIRGTNWIPEAMLHNNEERTYAEVRMTRQAGLNMIRLWGGGIVESDYFYDLCDEYGLLVWQEFFMTGNTTYVHDVSLYHKNVEETVKRLRNHPSLAYWVSSNESSEVSGTPELVNKLDGTRGYQMQSECCGIHDGSPYFQTNPMKYFDDSASERGSRINGFCPEYGAPTIPTVEALREMMDEKDLWPINDSVWGYHDGAWGIYEVKTYLKRLAGEYGELKGIEDFARKGQFVGAINFRSIWEVWNYNKYQYGDRYCSGMLFWYLNSPIRQVSGRMWDWSLEPTSALYYTQKALEPLHPQFDYLKNTVSVYNDYYTSFKSYKIKAVVYDLDMKAVFTKEKTIDIPEDGVVNDALTIDFPKNISSVHFIKLYLFDSKGSQVSDAFYWRSTNQYNPSAWKNAAADQYKGEAKQPRKKEVSDPYYWRAVSKYDNDKAWTGPTTVGFQEINKLKNIRLKVSKTARESDGRYFVDVKLSNISNTLAFFIQLRFLDASKAPIRPSFYTDNFFSLLPGENKNVTIETSKQNLNGKEIYLFVDGFNVTLERIKL
jgi:mannosylglycoprotein endo-beta-mannosidase